MKYLKKFETQSGYTEAYSELILPNVSLVTENNNVYCNSLLPPQPEHDYVEIGGVKWATMNIGANSVTDYGRYFQWADTEGDVPDIYDTFTKSFDWSTYPYAQISGGSGSGSGNGSGGETTITITKYNETDGKTRLEATDDAATVIWGVNWRMPTSEEIVSLIQNSTPIWVDNYEGSDVDGYLFTSRADANKKLFFPWSGYASENVIPNKNTMGGYWSANLDISDVGYAYNLLLTDRASNEPQQRLYGFPIRPVYDEGYGLRNNNEEEG